MRHLDQFTFQMQDYAAKVDAIDRHDTAAKRQMRKICVGVFLAAIGMLVVFAA